MEENISQKNKKQNLIIIILTIVIIVLIGIIIILLMTGTSKKESTEKENQTKKTYPTTYKPIDAVEHTKNADYENSMCSPNYLTGEFLIKDNNLYAVIDANNEYTNDLTTEEVHNNKVIKILSNVKQAFFVEEGQCGYHYAFATGLNGEFYYINNFYYAKQENFNVTIVNELKDIERLESREEDGSIAAYAIDRAGKEYSLYDIISNYSKLD